MGDLPSEKLKDGMARSKARTMRPSWTQSLADACQLPAEDIQFLRIEETQRIRAEVVSILKNHSSRAKRYHFLISTGDVPSADELLRRAGIRMLEQEVVLLSRVDALLGAVLVPCPNVIDHAANVWSIVDEDLIVATPDTRSGFCLERTCYDDHNVYTKHPAFEVTAWGQFLSPGT